MINKINKLAYIKSKLKILNFINILDLTAWILCYYQHFMWCIFFVIFADLLENLKEENEINQLKQRIEQLEKLTNQNK
jgi:hypothetical protein